MKKSQIKKLLRYLYNHNIVVGRIRCSNPLQPRCEWSRCPDGKYREYCAYCSNEYLVPFFERSNGTGISERESTQIEQILGTKNDKEILLWLASRDDIHYFISEYPKPEYFGGCYEIYGC